MTTYRRPLLGVLAAGFGAAAVIALGSGPALAEEMPTGHHHPGYGHHHHFGHHHGHHHFKVRGWGRWGCPPGPMKDGGHCRPHHPEKHPEMPSTR
ncbi:hypothetical protein AB0J52_35120 [Spirillospora sp. NPDC049652]